MAAVGRLYGQNGENRPELQEMISETGKNTASADGVFIKHNENESKGKNNELRTVAQYFCHEIAADHGSRPAFRRCPYPKKLWGQFIHILRNPARVS
jgi:hypothetical protein